jgi:hypothetical protein
LVYTEIYAGNILGVKKMGFEGGAFCFSRVNLEILLII